MKTREVTEKLQDFQRKATDTAKNMTESADEYIRENTWTGIACAALLGCVLGYLLFGRRSED